MTKKIHICDINNFYSKTECGVKTYLYNKLQYFSAREDLQSTVFIPSDREIITKENNINIVEFKSLKITKYYRLICNIKKLKKIINDLKPDIIEIGSPCILPWILKAAAKDNPVIFIGFWHANFSGKFPFKWWYLRQVYNSFAATFVSDIDTLNNLKSHKIKNLYLTPLGIDIKKYHPIMRNEPLRLKVGADKNRKIIFFPHRLVEKKGIDLLLEAFSQIYKEYKPILVIAGTGDKENKVKAFTKTHPDVHYLGYIEDTQVLAMWFASSDITVCLCDQETFGLSAAEALASGCPVIAPNQGSVFKFIKNSDGGVIVKNKTMQALIDSLKFLLEVENLDDFRVAARKYAEEHFDLDKSFERFVNYYYEVYNQNK